MTFFSFISWPSAFHKSLTVYLTVPIRWPFPFFLGSEPATHIAPISPHHICHPPASRLFLLCFVPYFAPSESSACHCLPPLSLSIITFELRSGTFLDVANLVLPRVSIVSILGSFLGSDVNPCLVSQIFLSCISWLVSKSNLFLGFGICMFKASNAQLVLGQPV